MMEVNERGAIDRSPSGVGKTAGERGRRTGNDQEPEQLHGLSKPVCCKEGPERAGVNE